MKTVYFLRPVDADGPIKIGCSVRPARRIRDLEIWSPVKLEMIASAPGENFHENALHHRFAEFRLHGEWFEACPELTALVERVRETGELPPIEIPTSRKEWKKYNEVCKSKPLERRNAKGRMDKWQITTMVRRAERRAFAWDAPEHIRPLEIQAIVEGYQGFASPLPSEQEIALVHEYIDGLSKLPAADRSYAAWVEWQRKAAA